MFLTDFLLSEHLVFFFHNCVVVLISVVFYRNRKGIILFTSN